MTRLREVKPEEPKTVPFSQKKQPPRIVNCLINKDKLISQLDDGREISISVSLLTKWKVLDENVKPEQLKKYELQSEGRIIYFPDIDEVLPSWKITEGLFSCN